MSYSGLLADSAKTLERITAALDLPFRLTKADRAKVETFLSNDLRHHRAPEDEVSPQLSRVPGLEDAYAVLSHWADGNPDRDADYRRLDQARHRVDQTGELLAEILESNRLERKRRASATSQADAALAELNRAQVSLQNLGELERKLDDQKASLDALASDIRDQRAIERLRTVVETLSSELRDRSASDRALASLAGQTDALNSQVAQLKQELEDARSQAHQLASKLRTRENEIEEIQTELSTVRDQLKSVKRKYRSTQDILDREREHLKVLRRNLAAAESSLAEYHRSLPWRLYTVLANVLRKTKRIMHRALGVSSHRRRHDRVSALCNSQLFDASWYLETYPDVAASGIDPAVHYLEFGWREGRDPGPHFSTTAYLKANADVAARGANPLLHYVEYGHFEGRSAPEHKAPLSSTSPREEFGPAAPSAIFSIEPEHPLSWTPSGQIEGDDPRSFVVDGRGVAYVPNPAQRRALEATLSRLAKICISGAIGEQATDVDMAQAELLDAWHAGRGVLRSRWRIAGQDAPIAVRVLEIDSNGEAHLAGETLVESELEAVDAKPANPLFPLLFVFTQADGILLGWRALVFPSLARGGLHYGEFIALSNTLTGNGEAGKDVCAISDILTEGLVALRDGATPLVASIAVDIRGQDGTHPLFQREFQSWLSGIARIGAKPLGTQDDQPESAYLARTVTVEADDARQSGQAVLQLTGDMIPTISVLVAPFSPTRNGDCPAPAMIVLGKEPSQPATLIRMPTESASLANELGCGFPRLVKTDGSLADVSTSQAIALRLPAERTLTDAELLMPIATPGLTIELGSEELTWFISPSSWAEADLLQALQSLNGQVTAAPFNIAFVSSPTPDSLRLAQQLFPDRVRVFSDAQEAIERVEGPLLAYLGPGVILHDVRSSALLTSLLREPGTATSSAVLLSVESRGKGWSVAAVDAGQVHSPVNRGGTPAGHGAAHATALWRSCWPVMLPPRDLWVARLETVRQWRRNGQLTGRHLCTSLVTASYCAKRSPLDPIFAPPEAAADRALSTEVLVG
ncbi:MAG TPA: hypothetical protein VE968_05375 [Sphingomicrobium sp.]|nr:hypothetical protein [Sphingomicrobium sp.]